MLHMYNMHSYRDFRKAMENSYIGPYQKGKVRLQSTILFTTTGALDTAGKDFEKLLQLRLLNAVQTTGKLSLWQQDCK